MNKIKLSTFNLYDEYGWPKEAILKEAQSCALRRAEILGWTDVEAKALEEEPAQNGKYTVHRFDVYGIGTPELEELPVEKAPQEQTEGPITPFANLPDSKDQITVKSLTEMLLALPTEYDNFKIKYDSACGSILKGEFTIYKEDGTISINGY